MVFVSTGRCGTRRLYEIFREFLPPEVFATCHQVKGSRLANVLGNILLFTGDPLGLREWLYRAVVVSSRGDDRFRIITDPLTAMVLPDSWIRSHDVAVIHVIRDDQGFARSMVALSRSRRNSFLAHNFIPLWQPYLFPLQYFLNPRLDRVYARINRKKNRFLNFRCRRNLYYRKVTMEVLFSTHILEKLIQEFFGSSVVIPKKALEIRSNESTATILD